MREVVLDIETTGLDPLTCRITEIGCVELYDREITGNTYHQYINPEIPVSQKSFEITGLSNEFLQKYPPFKSLAQSLLDFLQDAPIVAHNATFDISFLQEELKRNDCAVLHNTIIDTLAIARTKYRTGNSLDALCKKFNISNKNRDKHGALLDANLLAQVYYNLTIKDVDVFSFFSNEIENNTMSQSDIDKILKHKRSHFIL